VSSCPGPSVSIVPLYLSSMKQVDLPPCSASLYGPSGGSNVTWRSRAGVWPALRIANTYPNFENFGMRASAITYGRALAAESRLKKIRVAIATSDARIVATALASLKVKEPMPHTISGATHITGPLRALVFRTGAACPGNPQPALSDVVLGLGGLDQLLGKEPSGGPGRLQAHPHPNLASRDLPSSMASLWKWLFPKRESAERDKAGPLQAKITVEASRRRPPARPQKKPPSQRSTVYSEEYLPRERADTIVKVDDQGMPNLRLKRVRDTLVLEAPGGEWINPYSATVRRLGITIFKVRGASYYEEGSFSPWSKVRLLREPDNEYD